MAKDGTSVRKGGERMHFLFASFSMPTTTSLAISQMPERLITKGAVLVLL